MHQPTERVIRVLETAAARGGGRLTDFSAELGIPKSTLLPILTTLTARHYLMREGERYYPGAALLSLSRSFNGESVVMELVHRELTLLVEEFGETCYFGVLDGGSVRYLDKVDSPNPLRMLTAIGTLLPAYATGIGKALLIGKTESELRALYPDGLAPLTPNTVLDIPKLCEQLSDAEKSGYAWEIEESTEFIRCFAAPIRRHGCIAGAISIAIPTFRYKEQEGALAVGALLGAAERLGSLLEATDGSFRNIFSSIATKG